MRDQHNALVLTSCSSCTCATGRYCYVKNKSDGHSAVDPCRLGAYETCLLFYMSTVEPRLLTVKLFILKVGFENVSSLMN